MKSGEATSFPPRVLETERLRLRPPTEADAPRIHGTYASCPKATRYLTFVPNPTPEVTLAFVRHAIGTWETGSGHFVWVLERRADGRLIGGMGFDSEEDRHSICMGYVLGHPFWGQGYATEALRAVLERAFEDPTLYRAWAVCDVDHIASARVMEKAGMHFEGVLGRFMRHPNVSSEPRDCRCYARVR